MDGVGDDIHGKVYVGNIDVETTEEDLKEEFGRYGDLERCWIAKSPGGFAFVWFREAADAEAAVRGLDDATVKGRVWKVELAKERVAAQRRASKGPGGYRVRIKNLPRGVDWREIKDAFRRSGDVTYANVIGDGDGIAEYSSEEDRERAIADFDGTMFKDNKIQVEKTTGSTNEFFARKASQRYDRRSRSPPRRRHYDDRSSPPPSRGSDGYDHHGRDRRGGYDHRDRGRGGGGGYGDRRDYEDYRDSYYEGHHRDYDRRESRGGGYDGYHHRDGGRGGYEGHYGHHHRDNSPGRGSYDGHHRDRDDGAYDRVYDHRPSSSYDRGGGGYSSHQHDGRYDRRDDRRSRRDYY